MNSTLTHCPMCGVPMDASMCAVCGASGLPLPLEDGEGELPASAAETGRPELEWAGEAWARGEYSRVVAHCLSAEGAQGIKNRTEAEGPAFVAVLNGIAVIIRVLEAQGLVAVETPVVRLPATHYVGAMRCALELSAGTRSPARYAARGDLLVLRSVGALSSMSPAVLQYVLRSVVASAIDDAKVLATSVHARPLSPKEHIHLDLDALPPAVHLDARRPQEAASARSSLKRPMAQDLSFALDAPRQSAPAELPKEPRPRLGAQPTSGLGAPPPTVTPEVMMSPAIKTTTVSAGMNPGRKPSRPRMAQASAAAIPTVSPTSAPITPTLPAGGGVKPLGAGLRAPIGAGVGGAGGVGSAPATPLKDKPAGLQKPGIRRPSAAIPQAVVTANAGQPTPTAEMSVTMQSETPAAALAELLHKAQTLGAVLSFADQPASMALLIRATVYRTLLEFDATLPAAVSHLWSATVPLTKEIYITAPGIRRGAMAIPSANPAFEAMQRIVDARGEVPSAETPQITPITTSQEAKQHLARYVSEIDQAPKDLELRHFLALGALSELLVRAKLPPPTLERLRGIINHAKKDGATQPVVDLMMTALSRMMA